MMKYLPILLLPILFALFSCGPQAPSEAEVKAYYVGEYCAGDYKLELTDSTYRSRKTIPSPLGSGFLTESCNGNWSLVLKNGEWHMEFAKDENPRGIQTCETSMVVWTKDGGFGSENKITLQDLIDGEEVVKGACEF